VLETTVAGVCSTSDAAADEVNDGSELLSEQVTFSVTLFSMVISRPYMLPLFLYVTYNVMGIVWMCDCSSVHVVDVQAIEAHVTASLSTEDAKLLADVRRKCKALKDEEW